MNNLVNNFIWNGVHWTRMRGNQNGSLTVNGDIKITDRYGNVESEGASYKSVFGEQISVPITPVVQLDGLYGLSSKDFETFTAVSGTATTNNNMLEVTTGTTAGYGYGVIRSQRVVRYRPGQGSLARFTAKFTSTNGVGTLGYTQRAGFFTQEQAIQVGFDTNGKFGILRQNGGKAHIETLTITSGSTSAASVVITLNNIGYSVPLSDTTGNVNFAAATIGEWFLANASNDWTVDWYDNIVQFVSTSNGPKSGVFTFVPGTTGSSGTLSTSQTGISDTNTWTYQEDWNDTLDGSGVSGIVLDPSKLNIYQIDFRWLGTGIIRFAVENPDYGDMYEFHRLKFSNRQEFPHIDNPSLKLGYVAARLSDGTLPYSDVKVCGASMMGAIQGLIELTNQPTAVTRLTPSLSLAADKFYHGITLHNRLVVNNKINLREVILQDISLAIDTQSNSGKPVEVLMFYEFPVSSLPQPFILKENGQDSITSYSISDGAEVLIGNQVPIATYFASGDTGDTINLIPQRIVIPPNKSITVLVRSTVQITSIGVSLTFIED